ncbi:MAG: hypothetical protein ACR2QC_12445 [Gammaproteobacteria bacterium]
MTPRLWRGVKIRKANFGGGRNPPTLYRHSGESRNLIRRKANPPFALRAKEIPAFAGMVDFLFRVESL